MLYSVFVIVYYIWSTIRCNFITSVLTRPFLAPKYTDFLSGYVTDLFFPYQNSQQHSAHILSTFIPLIHDVSSKIVFLC